MKSIELVGISLKAVLLNNTCSPNIDLSLVTANIWSIGVFSGCN